MISIKNISKSFGKNKSVVKALDEVSLQVDKGEIFGVIGLSGAGKSTLIRTINRLEDVDSGEIQISGELICELDDKTLNNVRKKIGMIFQHFHLLSSRTVAGNISFPLEIAGWKKDDITKRVEDLLELVGLPDKKNSYPNQLSGGQKQRVAIARALANNPKLLLCDEATSALDPITTRSILQLLKKINFELGLTIILITHEMEVIESICDQVAVMEKGRVIERGRVEYVLNNPQCNVTKEFLIKDRKVVNLYDAS